VYGKPTATGTLANEYDFAGQETDGTGLQYLRARYMDPDTGRFISRDPMAAGPAWGQHPFGYAGASPASSADPTGLWCVWGGCVDRDGASIGGHEVAEGLKRIGQGLWWAERERLNAPLSAAAKAWALQHGGNCRSAKHGMTVCYGMDAGSIPDGHSTLTVGNVVMTLREKDQFDDRLFGHEERHADQWALASLACSANPAAMVPFVGGLARGACAAILGGSLYSLFPDFFESLADKEDGCYGLRRRQGCDY
jgi:RHS repeat-associated protein